MVNIWNTTSRTEEGLAACLLVQEVDVGRMEDPASNQAGSMRRFWAKFYHWQFIN